MKEFIKNIVLLPMEHNGIDNKKGILTTNCSEKTVKCLLKCYNFKPTDEEFLLGIMVNEKIFKTKVKVADLSNLTYIVPMGAKANDKISCVLLNLNQSGYDVLLWGSTETTKAWQNTAISSLNNELETDNQKQSGYVENSDGINSFTHNKIGESCQVEEDYQFKKEQQQVEEYIDRIYSLTEETSEMEKPNYNYYDENLVEQESEYNKKFAQFQSPKFYNRVESQVKNLLSKNSPDELLEEIIPSGKFCKVKLDNSFYVFGVIYEDSEAKYLCYGIPSNNSEKPPKELEGFCQWLPLNVNEENGSGYWISYQDAETGENIKVEVIS